MRKRVRVPFKAKRSNAILLFCSKFGIFYGTSSDKLGDLRIMINFREEFLLLKKCIASWITVRADAFMFEIANEIRRLAK